MLDLFKKLLDEDIEDSVAEMFLKLASDSIKNYLKVDYLEFKTYKISKIKKPMKM